AAGNAGEVRACVHCENAAGVSTDATRGRRASAHARVGWSGWDRAACFSAPARPFAPGTFSKKCTRDDVDFVREFPMGTRSRHKFRRPSTQFLATEIDAQHPKIDAEDSSASGGAGCLQYLQTLRQPIDGHVRKVSVEVKPQGDASVAVGALREGGFQATDVWTDCPRIGAENIEYSLVHFDVARTAERWRRKHHRFFDTVNSLLKQRW
ncbi:MAG: hypothetical protein Q8O67_25875, partial [Deltaproteobacteria bacterium]|nr:hypothetical protein [Deltaproteobacteria bacterium]